ncbi:MAG: pyridoxine 5'-phosphate synthase [Bacteroidales bacterium]|nr:pyridoxine 5'-phosphate synthase [Bacteroidales bacterium]
MTRLSVNINKIATVRNARGGSLPDVRQAAIDCQKWGAEGITVHPRPDERHIRYSDVYAIKPIIVTEFNIEGNPLSERACATDGLPKSFMDLVLDIHPDQVTLVPDSQNAITSNHGWDTIANRDYLRKICGIFRSEGIRSSIFVDPDPEMVRRAADCGCDRVELYTQSYAEIYPENPEQALEPFYKAALAAREEGLGLNAGHDLSLVNLEYFAKNIPALMEVSIGHALICDALYLGLEKTIGLYLKKLLHLQS